MERRSPQESFEYALLESNQTMCPVGWVTDLIDALRAVANPQTDPQIDSERSAPAVRRQIREILARHTPVGEGTPWCMTLSDYCDTLGLSKSQRETYRKRARRLSLPGAFQIGRSWFVCGFSPLARA